MLVVNFNVFFTPTNSPTRFQERQRDKNSPYNFSVQPMMRIDLDTYEKTGEARIIPLKPEPEEEEPELEPASPTVPTVPNKSPTLAGAGVGAEEPERRRPQSGAAGAPAAANPLLASEMMASLSKAAAAFSGINNYAALAMAQSSLASLLGPAGQAAAEESAAADSPLAQLLHGFSPAAAMVAPMLQQQQQQQGQLQHQQARPGHQGAACAPASTTPGAGGRRANRTRFTDFQLRTLQEFFDKQAYPKDDDLEMLSKKLALSPRVIVVWFQNARQKARKIYENQPNQDSSDRFIRTPGCNFQCKRCQLVFQRYYELIQHQQRVCYANDTDAQQTDNKVSGRGLHGDLKYRGSWP